MSTSSIPAFKAALKTSLVSLQATTLTGVQVSYGAPAPTMQAECIVLADANPSSQEPVFLGRNSRNEDYDLDVYVRVRRQTTDQQAVTERAFAITAAIENALRSDPTLGSVVREAKVGRVGLAEFASDDGLERVAVIDITVNVINRI